MEPPDCLQGTTHHRADSGLKSNDMSPFKHLIKIKHIITSFIMYLLYNLQMFKKLSAASLILQFPRYSSLFLTLPVSPKYPLRIPNLNQNPKLALFSSSWFSQGIQVQSQLSLLEQDHFCSLFQNRRIRRIHVL